MHPILGTMTFSDQVDQATSAAMVNAFTKAGHDQLDTAHVYNEGKTEQLLGVLSNEHVLDGTAIATKVNPKEGGLGADSINRQFTLSLERLGESQVDLLYLHMPDLDTPIEQTLAAVYEHFQSGRFKRFGLSNYAAWQVAEIAEMCEKKGWMRPAVYQGMYNAYTRDVERELFPCLRNYDIAFYAYNPLAGGILTGKYQSFDAQPEAGRFVSFGFYKDRYWKQDYFNQVQSFVEACKGEGIEPVAAALRWLVHHSAIADGGAVGSENGVILGASSISQLQQNLQAVTAGELPQRIVETLDTGWELVRPACIKYFRP